MMKQTLYLLLTFPVLIYDSDLPSLMSLGSLSISYKPMTPSMSIHLSLGRPHPTQPIGRYPVSPSLPLCQQNPCNTCSTTIL